MVVYDDGIFIDTGRMMLQMKNYIASKEANIKFETRKINSFDELEEKVIINCTGLGSFELKNDDQLVFIQGHLIMLKDQNREDLEYMISLYFGKDKTKSRFDVNRSFYMFPKRLPGSAINDVGVLGGTYIEGADANHPNEEEFEVLLNRAREFYGITDKSH